MDTRLLLAVLLLAAALTMAPAAHALDGDPSALAAPTRTPAPMVPHGPREPPDVRFDLVASLGLGSFEAPAVRYERTFGSLSLDVRAAWRSGNGLLARATYGTNVWGEGYGVDLDYLRRLRVAGDDRLGVGVDLALGPTLVELDHDESTVPRGTALGANLGGSVDVRLDAFVVEVGVQYRLLVPTDAAPDGSPTGAEHVLLATVGIGLGVYGDSR